jgi:hypothetical protein
MELTEAEQQMIELLWHDKHITLTIHQEGGQWHMRLEDHDSGIVGDGHGTTFDRAWDDIVASRLRKP